MSGQVDEDLFEDFEAAIKLNDLQCDEHHLPIFQTFHITFRISIIHSMLYTVKVRTYKSSKLDTISDLLFFCLYIFQLTDFPSNRMEFESINHNGPLVSINSP